MDWREQEEESSVAVAGVGWRAYLKVVWQQTLNVLTFGAIARAREERVKQVVAMETLAAQMAPAAKLPGHTHAAQAPHDAPLTPNSTSPPAPPLPARARPSAAKPIGKAGKAAGARKKHS